MIKVRREDIQVISRHSNWSEKSIEKILKQEIYNNKESWLKFLRLFFIGLGVCFTTAGIILFFVYTWDNLHKFIKISIIEGLIVITTLIVLFSKVSLSTKNILLTTTSILIGVLFAVFSQVYKTGANAYDFFLGWTISIALWVGISNFAPLWLIFIILVNTTFILYAEQVAYNWSGAFFFTSLCIINILFLTATLLGNKIVPGVNNPPVWFSNLIALASVFYSTIGVTIGIYEKTEITLIALLITMVSLFYFAGIKYGLKIKSFFYLSIIPLSIIVIIVALLIKISDTAAMFFFISLFVITSVTFVIRNLIYLQKEWIS